MRLAEKIISIRMRYLKKISYLCTCIFRQRFQDNMVRQCFILFGCLALGELIVRFTGVKLPASIIGMLILTLLLKLKVIKLE